MIIQMENEISCIQLFIILKGKCNGKTESGK